MRKYSYALKVFVFDMLIIEFGPVGVFFIAYYLSDFMFAALALGASTFIALVISLFVNKRVPWFAVFSGTTTILVALITYVYSAPWVLIIKDSIYYLSFALLLGFSLWKNLLLFKSFFGHVFSISNDGWRELEMRWLIFFILASLSNEIVRVILSPDSWVIYKQTVVIVFLCFGLYQFRLCMKYRLPEADNFGLRKLYVQNEKNHG